MKLMTKTYCDEFASGGTSPPATGEVCADRPAPGPLVDPATPSPANATRAAGGRP